MRYEIFERLGEIQYLILRHLFHPGQIDINCSSKHLVPRKVDPKVDLKEEKKEDPKTDPKTDFMEDSKEDPKEDPKEDHKEDPKEGVCRYAWVCTGMLWCVWA